MAAMKRVVFAVFPTGLSQYSRNNLKSIRLKSRYINKFLPPETERKVWNTSDLLRIVPKAVTSRPNIHNPKVLDLCQRLQDLSYDFKDIEGRWRELVKYDCHQVTSATHSLVAEGKLLTDENLLKGLENSVLSYSHKQLSSLSSREQHISILVSLLNNYRATEKLLIDFREKLAHYELSDRMFVDECTQAIYVAHVLLAHLGTSADSIMQEYNCLLAVDIYLLLDRLDDVRAFGIKKPNEIVNYILGIYMRPSRRAIKSYSTRAVLQLLGLSSDEADSLGFSKEAIQCILHSVNIETVEGTYDYLLNSGYTRFDIARVPFILAFSAWQIRELLEDISGSTMSEFNHLTGKTDKLNFLGRLLDELYGSKMERFYSWKLE
ncbi:uncharacterized protein [Watersipora subatra]|uniref:uncharacterized protein n=1 Tax=Watersipora subatra TaxID=2589382 RepID=UPI00355B2CB7